MVSLFSFSSLLKSNKLVVGYSKAFIKNKLLSFDGHTHSATDITSDILSAARGGTGYTSLDELASYFVSAGYFTEGPNMGGVTATIAPGTIVNWAGHTWIVVHVDNTLTYLAMRNIHSLTQFRARAAENSSNYSGSILASVAANFENSLPEVALNKAVEQTVSGVTAKIFVPTYNQATGGFEYYKTSSNRTAYYNDVLTSWWTSTPSNGSGSHAAIINTAGTNPNNSSSTNIVSLSLGFRPHVALRL